MSQLKASPNQKDEPGLEIDLRNRPEKATSDVRIASDWKCRDPCLLEGDVFNPRFVSPFAIRVAWVSSRGACQVWMTICLLGQLKEGCCSQTNRPRKHFLETMRVEAENLHGSLIGRCTFSQVSQIGPCLVAKGEPKGHQHKPTFLGTQFKF